MEELIAKRYAQALLSVANKTEKKAYIKTLNEIAASFENKEVLNMIEAPIVSVADKVNAILDALGEKADPKLVNFIKLLAEKKRLPLIPALATVLNMQMQKESNAYNGIIKSKNKLDKSEVGKLEETLKRYTGSSIKLKQEKSDLDGLRVDVDDLGIEVNFSKERVKEQLIDFIMKSH
jgi:F-type H+-transporting ATPase subunit delta